MRLIDLDEVKPATLRDIAQIVAAEFHEDDVLQILVGIFSIVAILLVASTGPWHKWGFVVGLMSQPLWIAALWRSRTRSGSRPWGMLFLSVLYVFVWIEGIFNRF